MTKYKITFILNNRDEQVITTYAGNTQTALQNAIRSIDLEELDHWTLSNGIFVDKFDEVHYDLHDEYINSTRLFVGGGFVIVVPDSSIYIDEFELIKKPVAIKRGDFIEYTVPTAGMDYIGGGVAWFRFKNQFGSGWVLVNENNPSQNASVYDEHIYAVDRITVEYNKATNEHVRIIWNDENEEAGA